MGMGVEPFHFLNALRRPHPRWKHSPRQLPEGTTAVGFVLAYLVHFQLTSLRQTLALRTFKSESSA